MSDIVYKNFGFSTPFLKGYQELKIPIIDADGNPTWPELFPISRIEELRIRVGARHFSAQMMLEYIPLEKARLDPDALHLYSAGFDIRTAKIGKNLMTGVAFYWDPSLASKKSDNSVCVLLYRDDRNQKFFIHDVLYLSAQEGELYPLARQCETVLDFMSRHYLHCITIETNGLGNALPEIIQKEAVRRNMNISVQKQVNTKKKELRILDSIEPILNTGRLYAHRRVQSTPILAEMLGWTPGCVAVHDDGLDALSGAIMATPATIRPLGQGIKIFTANTNFKI